MVSIEVASVVAEAVAAALIAVVVADMEAVGMEVAGTEAAGGALDIRTVRRLMERLLGLGLVEVEVGTAVEEVTKIVAVVVGMEAGEITMIVVVGLEMPISNLCRREVVDFVIGTGMAKAQVDILEVAKRDLMKVAGVGMRTEGRGEGIEYDRACFGNPNWHGKTTPSISR